MKRRISALTDMEFKVLVKRVNEVLSDEFDITDESIHLFWVSLNKGSDRILYKGKQCTLPYINNVAEICDAEDAIEASQGEVGL